MVIAILFCISWLLLAYLITSPKALNRREGAFLFMCILSVNISVSWIVGYEMGKIAFAKQPVEYLGYLLHRSVLVPLLPTMCVNFLLLYRRFWVRASFLIGYGLVMWGIEAMCLYFNSFTFPHWNMAESLVTYYLYLLLGWLLLKGYRRAFSKQEVRAA
ncbi:hypothetical protein JJB07_14445 [Tumebacillus sp. ITR2]|uniref:Uncharacterized protein n=1 Tax=Tumebacillus amylolyticus TaxID=2801339 RepID=A0ABS1JC44_9BACL|nr:hypothetical protein [Tumebacillus amylolyticus]MBL0387837.1 hypothetical protein [Tumebacillus amylolyticus]